jgi:hypothetical protein
MLASTIEYMERFGYYVCETKIYKSRKDTLEIFEIK